MKIVGAFVALVLLTVAVEASGARTRAPLPSLGVGNATATQPDAGTTSAVVRVRLSRASSKSVRVR